MPTGQSGPAADAPSATDAAPMPPSEDDGSLLPPSATISPAPTEVPLAPDGPTGDGGADGSQPEGPSADAPAADPEVTPEPEPVGAPAAAPEPGVSPEPVLTPEPEPDGLTAEQLDAMIQKGVSLEEIGGLAPVAFIGGMVDKSNFTAVVAGCAGGEVQWSGPLSIDELLGSYPVTGSGGWAGALAGVQGAASTDMTSSPNRFTFAANFPQIEGREVSSLTVNGSNVVRIGNVQIQTVGGSTHNYVYYSASESTGSMTSAVLNSGETIRITYSLKEYPITYEIYDESGSILNTPGYTLNDIFGPHRATATQDQWLSVDVTIPAGHYGSVYIGDTAGFDPSSTEKFPQETGYGEHRLGEEVVWKAVSGNNGGAEIDTAASGAPDFFTLNGTYISGGPGSADAPQTVRVVITTRPESDYHFNAQFLANALSGDEANSKKWSDHGALNSFEGKNFEYVPASGTYSCSWSFVMAEAAVPHYEMRSLSINNAHLNIPFLKDPRTLLDNNGNLVDPSSPDNRASAATVLPDGMTVTITVEPRYVPDKTAKKQRAYTISVTNASRDIVFDHGTFINAEFDTYSEVVASQFTGVDVQAFRKPLYTEPDTNVRWVDFLQAQSIRAYKNQSYTFFYNKVGDPTGRSFDLPSTPSEGPYGNIRFRLREGYNWAGNVTAGTESFPTVTFHEKQSTSGQSFESSHILGPDGDGWYYVTLADPNTGADGTHIGMLTIQAEPMLYQIQYQDGITDGSALNPDAGDLTVRNMPVFRELNDDGSEIPGSSTTIDTNRGRYYSLVRGGSLFTSDRITISGVTPTTGGEHPATFLGWVLTDKDGHAIGSPEKLVKPNDLVSLRDIDQGATVHNVEDQDFTIYLTAKWSPQESSFAYYTTFNYMDEAGMVVKRWGEPSDQPFPGGADGEKYVSRRQVYTALTAINVVFEPDKSTTAEKSRAEQWLESHPWYKYDSEKNGSAGHEGEFFWENVANNGEVDVWFISSLGRLTIHKTLTAAAKIGEGEDVTFEATFKLPDDDPDTGGDESEYFEDGLARYTVSGEGDEKSFSVTKQGDGTYKGTFHLAVGKSAVFLLPGGTTYTIAEAKSALFEDIAPVSGAVTANAGSEHTIANVPTGLNVVKTQTIEGVTYKAEDSAPLTGAGDQITYTVTVTNRNVTRDVHVKVSDAVPTPNVLPGDSGDHLPMRVMVGTVSGGGRVVGGDAVPGGGDTLRSGGTVEWDEVALSPGQSEEFSFTCVVPIVQHKHDYANTAKVEYYSTDPGRTTDVYSEPVTVTAEEDWLRIEKTVSPRMSASGETFQFEVSLTAPGGEALATQYDYIGRVAAGYEGLQTAPPRGSLPQTGGKLSVSLEEGQAVTIYGLAPGTRYTVTEQPKAGFYIETASVTGTISEDSQDWARFANLRTGLLEINKTVPGAGAPAGVEFPVSVKFTLPDGAKRFFGDGPAYSATTMAGHPVPLTREADTYTGTLSLTSGGPVRFTLPDGTEYEVEELPLADINATLYPARFENTGTTGGNGTISYSAASRADIENTFYPPGSLKVEKVLSGDLAVGDDRDWTFIVQLSDPTFEGRHGDMDFSAGKATVTMQGGQSRTADGIPAGTGYTVTEVERDQDGYTTTAKNDAGTIIGNATVTALFTNTRQSTPVLPPEPVPTSEPAPTEPSSTAEPGVAATSGPDGSPAPGDSGPSAPASPTASGLVSATPATGDEAVITPYVLMLALSVLGLAALFRKKPGR